MSSASVVLTSDTSGSVTVTVPSGTALGTTTLTLPTTGGTIQTSGSGFTTNGVAYASSTSALATGSALTWNGSNLAVTGALSVTQPITSTYTGTYAISSTSAGTGPSAINFYNTSGNLIMGVEGSAGGSLVTGSLSNAVILASYANKPIQFAINDSIRATIDTSGNLLVGKTAFGLAVGTSIDANTSSGGGVRVVSSSSTSSADGFQMYSTGASAYRFYVSFNGTINATSTTITGISDQRLKENIRDLDEGLSNVMALKPRKFDWKEGKGANIKNARGFIAQEFETVFPDMIEEWKDPAPEGEEPYKAVNANLIPTLVKAIQELNTLITAQSATITSLTERITALEGK
jgi:hypothetical protein